jgi:hypothetical protein
VLGSKYQTELLSQIPGENLPKAFGGKCECEGGCEMSDAGPWKEDQYSQPVVVAADATTIATAVAPATSE